MGIILKNVNLVDISKNRIREKVNITITGDTITDISADVNRNNQKEYQSINLEGSFASPGLIDLHTHLIWSAGSDPVRTVEEEGIQVSLLRAAYNARNTLESGITCVRDLGSNEDITISLAAAISRGYIMGPRIISSGCTIIITGGHDPFWGVEIDGQTEAIKAVRKQVFKGAKVIKISATGGVYGRREGEAVGTAELSIDEIKSICHEAHRFGLRVAAHAISEEGIWNCIDAGVDTIEHGHFLSESAMHMMKEKGIFWVPTLYVYRQIAKGEDLQPYAVNKARKIIDIHRQSFQAALDLGISIVAGSDAGSPNTPHGSLINELEYMVDYGCNPARALQGATTLAAQAIGMEEKLGSLEIGKMADIIISDDNPLDNLSSLRALRLVIKDGAIIRSNG